MKGKCTCLVTAPFLLLLLIVSISNTLRNQNSTQKYDAFKEAQAIATLLRWVLKFANFGTPNQYLFIEPIKFYGFVILKTGVITCGWYLTKHRYISDLNKKYNFKARHIDNRHRYKSEELPCELVIFMVAITFVKFIIIVIAVQLLLHNAYMIFTNFYHNYIKQLESVICNQSYQLISGHGQGDEGNFLQKKYQQKQQVLKRLNTLIEYILPNENADNFAKDEYSSINIKYELSLSALNTYKQNLYHQQQLNDNSFYHQFYYINNNYRCFKHQHRDYHRISYVKNRGYCHPSVKENIIHLNHQFPRPTHFLYYINYYCDNTLVSPILRQIFSSGTYRSKSKTKLMRAWYNCFRDCLTTQPTTPFIPLSSSSSSSSKVCCWKTIGNHKRRKRKNNLIWNKYVRNCNYLIWKRSFKYSCCSSEIVCIFCFRVLVSECFHIRCYYYRIFITDSKAGFRQTTLWSFTFCKQPISKHNGMHKKHGHPHPLNIIQVSKSSRQITADWCISGHHYDDNETNLLGSINTVKAIPPALQNLNYKRMFKNNLVWLFIGLVWLEGPKLINCSISHTNNDITNINGNETTNKFSSSHSSNNDSTGDNSGGSTGGQNESRNNSNNNANEPNPSSRQDTSDSNRQNIKSGNNLKEYNFKEKSASNAIKSETSVKQKVISVYHPVQINKQNILETYHSLNRTQQQKPYTVVRSDQPTNSLISSMFEKNVNRAQSDFARLESIKRQILTKLGLTEKPNVTHPLPKQFIWDTIYRADGIKSIRDLNFNDIHQSQEHIRMTTAILDTPPLISDHYPPTVNDITHVDEIKSDRLRIISDVPQNYRNKEIDVSSSNDMLSSSWRLLDIRTTQFNELEDQVISKYERRHRQLTQQQNGLRSNKNIDGINKNRYTDTDYLEGDEFFGSTQEIITFAEKGKIYRKHRLVEFSPPSNKIPKQKLQIRNAEIHIRIEKVSKRSSIALGQLQNVHLHRHKLSLPRVPNLKIWIFQLIGNDFSSKGFDQVATLCTSLSVDHKVLGWQKLDITETVQLWYSKHQKDKLRLLIDCTGCGNRYILHLFDKHFHHSILLPSVTGLHRAYPSVMEESASNTNALKSKDVVKNRYYYHYTQYNHHRYRRKNLSSPLQHIHRHTSSALNVSEMHQEQSNLAQQSRGGANLPSLWISKRTYREIKKLKTNNTSEEEMEGISYEVGGDFEIEDRLNPNRPFLVLHTQPNRSRRVRRRAVDCSGAMHGQCCKESFYVSFKALGWDDWIIAPRGYFANYCRGDCTGPFRTPDTFQTFHAHFIEEYRKMGLLNGMQPCCAPVKFSSMSLIYYGDDGIIKRDLPKMVVDECGCP